MIQLQQVGKTVANKTILHPLTLTIEQGESVGIIGANGAGKTTLLSLIATLSKPSTGEIIIQGNPIRTHLQQARQSLGYVAQEIALYPTLTVWDNLWFFENIANQQPSKANVQEIATRLGLNDRLNQKINQLSGGYQRRVHIAVALLHHPNILILDEPTVGVDMLAKQELLYLLKELSEQGITLLYTSHDVAEITFLTDRVIFLEEGKLAFDGSISKAKQTLPLLQEMRSKQ